MKINPSTFIDGSTRVMGIIGDDLSHSKSPAMHNYAAAKLGINAVYIPLPCTAESLPGTISTLKSMGSIGVNVTTPFKELAARQVGSELTSINTIKFTRDGFASTSTDGIGFERSLNRADFSFGDFKHVVILGSGGVVSALAEQIDSLSDSTVIEVFRRTSKNDEGLKSQHPDKKITFHCFELDLLNGVLAGKGKETILIQASSAPIRGDDLGWMVPALDQFRGVVVDLVYGTPSALYYHAVSRNLSALDGEGMLIEQARASQMFWWETCVSYDELAKVLRGK